MNDQDLTSQHGYPLRLIVPGWYGMASVKWLQEITAITQPFTGFFQSKEYVYIGEHGIPDQTPVANMRVRSLITNPEGSTKISGDTIHISGIAWSGDGKVEKVELSFDNGDIWHEAALQPASTGYEVARWEYKWQPKEAGRYSIIARAKDTQGNTQPLKSIWNKGGYGNNAAHQIELTIE
jgi:DMSO/TMAO reductase YedYZ molybdopterin-dependent catalytic subunit